MHPVSPVPSQKRGWRSRPLGSRWRSTWPSAGARSPSRWRPASPCCWSAACRRRWVPMGTAPAASRGTGLSGWGGPGVVPWRRRCPVCRAKGLFRVAPSASKLKKLKAALDCCVVDVQEYSADPHAIAGGDCGGCWPGGAPGPKGCRPAPRSCFQTHISPGACTSSDPRFPSARGCAEQEMLCRSKGLSGMHMHPNGVCSLISAASVVVQDAPCMQSPACCTVKH